MIHFLFTGGTISMRRDTVAGGNIPVHGGDALVASVPELERIGPYVVEDWAKLPACHLGLDRLWALRERVRAVAASGAVSGIVVTHGTDLLEETAYLLDRTLDLPTVPVTVTGAMLTSSDPGWDGPRNLLDAATVAASAESAGRGTLVVFNGAIFAGRTATKTHTTDLAAFSAPHAGPLGCVQQERAVYPPGHRYRRGGTLAPHGLTARVALVPVVPGDDGAMLDLARPGHDGVVIAAFGSGNVPPGAVPAIRRWLDDGKPVVLASRCPLGEVAPLYAFEGGGAGLAHLGVTLAGPRTPWQARMELVIALSAGVPYGT